MIIDKSEVLLKKKKKKEDKSEASGSNIAMASMPDISKLQTNKIN